MLREEVVERSSRNEAEGRGVDERIVRDRGCASNNRGPPPSTPDGRGWLKNWNSKWEAAQRERKRGREKVRRGEEPDIHAYALRTQGKRHRAPEAENRWFFFFFFFFVWHCRCEKKVHRSVVASGARGCATLILEAERARPAEVSQNPPPPSLRRRSASLFSISLRRASPLRSQR